MYGCSARNLAPLSANACAPCHCPLQVPVRYAFAVPRESSMAEGLAGGCGASGSMALSKRGSSSNGTNGNGNTA